MRNILYFGDKGEEIELQPLNIIGQNASGKSNLVDVMPQSFNLLLVDSDDAVAEDEAARAFLQKKYKKWNLQKVKDEQCHLMARIMESWFLADLDALKDFYGKEFKQSKIPKNTNVEAIAKDAVEKSLALATAKTQKAEYHKIEHGAKILEIINPRKVCKAAFRCRELFKVISEKLAETE